MPYKEWIKRGRDPVVPRDYWVLSRSEAKAFLQKVIDAIPERLAQLTVLVREKRLDSNWSPNFTEEAFRTLTEVFDESIETLPRDPSEMERDRGERDEIFDVLNAPVRSFEFTDRSWSITFDCAVYFALDLMSKEPRLQWQLDEAKTVLTRNQPVLVAPRISGKPDRLECQPFDLFKDGALWIGEHGKPLRPWVSIYRYWMNELVPWYQRENPPILVDRRS